jgi:phosphatidylserine decarboxylase
MAVWLSRNAEKMRIAKEGLLFILPSLVLFLFSLAINWWPLAVLFLLLALAFAFFFRDPARESPEGEHLLLSPADGKVVKIESFASHPELSAPAVVVSIFLSLFDVHITRSPLTGTVEKMDYRPGKFFPAYKDEAGTQNESRSLFIKSPNARILLKQIVGVAARRIKCFVRENEKISRGQKIGLMYFGSRVDLYLPPEIRVKAGLSQKVKAGLTVIAEVKK